MRQKDIVRLRSYGIPENQEMPATIIEAARATSAATSFFEPVSIGARRFADGCQAVCSSECGLCAGNGRSRSHTDVAKTPDQSSTG